jgi:hypothetical protein
LRSKSIRWQPALCSEIGRDLVGFSYTRHGHERADERLVDEQRIKRTLEAPSRWADLRKNRYEFQKQFGDERLRIIAKITNAGWVNIISVIYMNEWQIFNEFRVGIR